MSASLSGQVAIVAGATRGAGRAIAVELGAAGATVYCSGRSTREARSEMDRPETIEETAERVTGAGGRGIAVRADHTVAADVERLVEKVRTEQDGRLDLLVNDIWGGDHLTDWAKPFWEHSLDDGLHILDLAVRTHLVTSWFAVRLMVARGRGLVVEITDGDRDDYRGNVYYDLAKVSANRLGLSQAADLRPHGVAAVALTPGFLRSEAMLDRFGVTEDNWQDAVAVSPHFIASETPHYVGRAVVALAADPDVMSRSGQVLTTWGLYKDYGFTDLNGRQPDCGAYYAEHVQEIPATPPG
jgi:NAD(P)-dependent dehydrogenase (short-subunit alcohol dehydrogenase family)